MANIRQARKRARQAKKRRERNSGLRSRARTYIKGVAQAVAAGDKAAAQEAYKQAVAVIDQIADKGILAKNAAARQKSRLNARVRALS